MVESIVYPNVNDKKLQDSYGAMGSDQLLGKMLTIGEIANVATAVQEA
ncbi:hypothetical protein [Lysinibacillus fusiformis]